MSLVPMSVYEKYAAGELTEEQVRAVEAFAESLEKNAFGLSDMGDAVGSGIGMGAGTMLGSAGAGLGMLGVSKLVGNAVDALTFRSDLARIMEAYPALENFPIEMVEMAYRSLRTLNPKVARDPMLAGTMLLTVLQHKDPVNPQGTPLFNAANAKAVTDVGSRQSDPIQDAMMGAVGHGVQGGIKGFEVGAKRDADELAEFRRAQNQSSHRLKNP